MNTSDFFYELPQELIAQTPVEPRDSSRLMVLHKEDGRIEHRIFKDIIEYLNPGDCLIVNNTKVIPARIYGVKKKTGAVVEFLLLKQKENNIWECLCKPGKRAKVGTEFVFGEGLTECEVVDVTEDGNRIIQFKCDSKEIYTILDRIGKMPLPPYITEELKNQDRYQTVYSKELGSAAAPTAGLHFTEELLEEIKAKGVNIGYVTLHVGLGTFRPVKVDDVTNHKMHSEFYQIPKETSELINQTKKNGNRVISVGTTSTRTLESVASKYGEIKEDEGDTEIFIYPGYEFKAIDAQITNFHLPESTLIMLVSAFAGYDNVMNAYKEAVNEKYRFFSFGDAMLII
ncbi:MAG: tRNA preQ1(34) S-adenosylmethionine ribosyltransferase-isomerase QueA [Ruminococcaceae bacterium]|nr:tRNA preQ1(34) S-adenosylmethionine ribosyltransferase-isomerase QueA [Oscillospiraceae bacterium]